MNIVLNPIPLWQEYASVIMNQDIIFALTENTHL